MKTGVKIILFLLLLGPAVCRAQEGMVLYTHGSRVKGTIHLAKLDSDGNIISDDEVYPDQALDPKFSPDGNSIVFAKDQPRAIWVMDLDGSNLSSLASCANDNYPLGSWRHQDRIYFNGGANLLCYHFGTDSTTVEATNNQQTFRELDISTNLRGVHGGMPPIWTFDLNAGTDAYAFDRCGGSISPDGSLVTNCHADHQGFDLRAWGDWSITSSISTPTQYEALNPQYSGNSNDHIVINIKNSSDEYQTWLHEISSNSWVQITDDQVANGAGDFFLGQPEQPDPQLTLSTGTLSFSSVVDGANPADKTVSVSNPGNGTLDTANSETHYHSGTGWLDITISGTGNHQLLTNSVDISGLQAGNYHATVDVECANAPNSPQSYEVSLALAPWSPALKRINCGTNSYTPAGWENDDPYVSGGQDYNFDGSWNLDAENAAPEAVYQTVRNKDHDYDFSDLSDGRYTVRFHMGDGAATDSRKMDFFMEGQQVLDDFSPGLEAGAGRTALVLDFTITVEDGNGLQIQARKDSGNDVFLCGIEIFEAAEPDNQPPVVDAGQDQSVSIDSSVLLFGIVADDGLPGPLTVSWSKLSGPGDITFDDAGSKSTNATFSATGDYDIRLTADDGELQGHDDLTISVSDAPTIKLQSPVGGEQWRVGTVQTIHWSTILIDDIVPYYSTDKGATWNKIENFIYKEDDPDSWGQYPWTVPDEASDKCLVRIEEYNNPNMFAVSETFTILAKSGSECPDGMVEKDGQCVADIGDDTQSSCGCSQKSDSAPFSILLVLLLFAVAKRHRASNTSI